MRQTSYNNSKPRIHYLSVPSLILANSLQGSLRLWVTMTLELQGSEAMLGQIHAPLENSSIEVSRISVNQSTGR